MPAADDWGVCLLCTQVFCRAHLVLKKGVATCGPCQIERERRESASGVSLSEEERIVELLHRDVERTIGQGFDDSIVEAAARHRLFGDPAQYEDEVVGDVQQHFHDAFVDTTWPSCPHHPNHPLWYSDGWWRCEQIDAPVARLGGLSKVSR